MFNLFDFFFILCCKVLFMFKKMMEIWEKVMVGVVFVLLIDFLFLNLNSFFI